MWPSCTRLDLSTHGMNRQHLHHGWIAFLVLRSFFLQVKATMNRQHLHHGWIAFLVVRSFFLQVKATMNRQYLHHGWIAFLVLCSFFLQVKATNVVVEALINRPERRVRVKAGYLNVSRRVDAVVRLAAVYEDVMRQRSDDALRDDVLCNRYNESCIVQQTLN